MNKLSVAGRFYSFTSEPELTGYRGLSPHSSISYVYTLCQRIFGAVLFRLSVSPKYTLQHAGGDLRFNLEHDFRQTNSIGAFGPLWRSTAFDLPFKNSVKSGGNGFS